MMIQVRAAGPSDATAIAKIHVASWQSTYAGIIPEAYLDRLSVDDLSADWARKIQSNANQISVALHNDEIVGFANLADNTDDDLKEEKLDLIELHALYFHPDSINNGLGTQMWGILEESLIGKLVVLWVFSENQDARHFYIKHGFEQDLVKGHLHILDQAVPRTRYRKLVC